MLSGISRLKLGGRRPTRGAKQRVTARARESRRGRAGSNAQIIAIAMASA
jgi:hypothetical protein